MGEIGGSYYTGPEERLRWTADEGGPKVILKVKASQVASGR
jgi:hypothetical protein